MSKQGVSTDSTPDAAVIHRQQSVTEMRSPHRGSEEESRLIIGRLLVAVDLSPESEKVIAVARRLALATGAQVFVVHCAEPDPDLVGYDRDVFEEICDEYRQFLGHVGIEPTAFLEMPVDPQELREMTERLIGNGSAGNPWTFLP